MSVSELQRFRDRQLRRVVSHAYRKVPYYAALLNEAGLTPTDIQSVDDLCRIPISTKRDLQRVRAEQLVSRDVNLSRLVQRKTSGSTGLPFTIRRTWFEERLLGAIRWRVLRDLGMRVTDRHAEIEELQPPDGNDNQLLHQSLQSVGFFRQIRIHALDEPDAIIEKLLEFGPNVITGYSGVLARVAKSMTEKHRAKLRPRFIAGHSDLLTPAMCEQISEGFGAPFYEIYDSNEFNVIAWQCPQTNELHTCDDTTIVEVANADSTSDVNEGEVVLTALHSFAMPFIRFALGDIITKGSEACRCGHPFGTIRAVRGRMFDYFPLPDGRVIHPYELIAILTEHGQWTREYRIVQRHTDDVLVQVVPGRSPRSAEVSELRHEMSKYLGERVNVTLDIVSELPLEQTGKFRVCRSLVQSEYDGVAD